MPPEPRGRIGLFRRFLDQRDAGSTPRWAEAVSRCLTIDDLRQTGVADWPRPFVSSMGRSSILRPSRDYPM
jgi:hypothetical protein